MMPTINVDLGIEGSLRFIDDVLARRQKHQNDLLSALSDDLDIVSNIITTLDNLFIDLVRGFTNPRLTEQPAQLQTHVEETRKYLTSRNLLPKLEERLAILKSIAFDPRFQPQAYRELVTTLRTLARRLDQYRDGLGRGAITGVGQKEHWNLMTLYECATRDAARFDLKLEEMAEEVLRNHDFELSAVAFDAAFEKK